MSIDKIMETLLQPGKICGVKGLTHSLFIDGVKKTDKGYLCDARGIQLKGMDVNATSFEFLYVDGELKRFPKGKCWVQLKKTLECNLKVYIDTLASGSMQP
jgi:hypothetical protein